jgi:hypothetical protein
MEDMITKNIQLNHLTVIVTGKVVQGVTFKAHLGDFILDLGCIALPGGN